MVCVILAAGRSQRFGRDKLLVPVGGITLIERAIAACRDFAAVVVCSPDVAVHADALGARAIVNTEPERGMSYSLRLANAAVDPRTPIAVLPADLLLIEPEHVTRIAALREDADVTYPVSEEGTPGHPVMFSARARERISALSDGDTIRVLRDDPELRRKAIVTPERWPFRDVDRESDLADL